MKAKFFNLLFVISFILFVASVCVAKEFPYREKYPDVPVIELSDARNSYEKEEIVFVDARTKTEFDTFHPKKALNIDFSQDNFVDILVQIRETNPNKKIAVYGDGVACLKAYRAVQDASDEGMENIYAYDAGVEAWIASYPSDTMLMGQQIDDAKVQLITKEELHRLTLNLDQFKQMINESPNAMVFDIRDPIQRKKKVPGLEQAISISLEKFIRNVISKGNLIDKQLFIIDHADSQIGWLTNYLKDEGYTNFYFLEGGVT